MDKERVLTDKITATVSGIVGHLCDICRCEAHFVTVENGFRVECPICRSQGACGVTKQVAGRRWRQQQDRLAKDRVYG